CHYRLSHYDEAANEFTEAFAIDPNLANAAYYLGEIEHRRGRRQAARQFFRNAIKINPDHKGARQMLESIGSAPPPSPSTLKVGERTTFKASNDAASPFMRALTTDPSPASKEAVALIEELNMSVRPRIIPYILPKLLMLGVVVCIYLAALLLLNGRQHDPTF